MDDQMDDLVLAALTSGDWGPVLVAVDEMYAEGSNSIRGAARHIGAIADALTHTEPATDLQAQAHRIADWLVMATDQAVFAIEHRGEQLEWVTRHDSAVRPMHVAADGQRRDAGSAFDIGGHALLYPGQPVGEPEVWYNCRCYLRLVEDLAAALTPTDPDEVSDSAVIVLLPSAEDPVNGLGPETSHVTLAFLGEQQISDEAALAIADYAASLSPDLQVAVTGVDTFGPEEETQKAQVLTLADDVPTQIRDGLLAVLGEHGLQDASDWPDYRPHLTLGYDDPTNFEVPQTPESITFDRLGIWTPEGKHSLGLGESAETADDGPEEEIDGDEVLEPLEPLAFHGIAVVEGVPTDADDGLTRTFAPNSLTWRTPPMTLTFEHIESGLRTEVLGHIDRMWRLPDRPEAIAYEGAFDDNADADARIGQIANGTLGKVSVHVGASQGTAAEAAEGENVDVTFSTGKIASLAVVPMPGFEHCYIALGPWPVEPGTVPGSEVAASADFASEQPWDGSASRFTDEQWKRSCIVHVCDGMEKSCHKMPIREPGGALSRAGVHAAAGRLNQVDAPPEAISKAKASLRGAYQELGEEPPESIAASLSTTQENGETHESVDASAAGRDRSGAGDRGAAGLAALTAALGDFKRGPGWVTDPVPTARIHRYWTRPGQPGYVKIGWGTGGDFYRCRHHLAKYVDLRYLNQVCAQWHHDALGIWPGEHFSGGAMTAAAALPEVYRPPLEWFSDPGLFVKTGLTITEEGRIFGHLATFDQCHVSYGEMAGKCVIAPHSATNYAFFRLGKVLTTGGEVGVGQIVLGGGHAGGGASMAHAQDHYASTSRAVADISVGEDSIGIWFSGAVRPGISAEDLYALRAAKLSGDWRTVRGALELVAALAVNVPGFPVPEMSLVASANGGLFSLTAAAIVQDEPEPEGRPAVVEAAAVAQAASLREIVAAMDRVSAARAAKSDFRVLRARKAKVEIGSIH